MDTRFLLAAALLASACMTPVPLGGSHVARPGFVCVVGIVGDGAWASATLDGAGRQLRAEWNWRRPLGDPARSASAVQMVDATAAFDPAQGLASLDWVAAADRPRVRRARLTLVAGDGVARWAPIFAGLWTPGEAQLTISASLLDIITYARGARRLWLVIEDQRRAVVVRREIAPGILVSGWDEIIQAIADLSAATRDFRHRCTAVVDVENDVVVT